MSVLNIIWLLVSFYELPHTEADNKDAPQPALDWGETIPFAVCCWCFMVIIATFSIFETMLTIYTSGYYNWGVTQNGILLAIAGVIGIAVFVIIGLPWVNRLMGDRFMLVGGFSLLGISCILLSQWPVIEDTVLFPQFVIGAALQAIGYPVCSVALNSLSSKVIHPKAQGSKMGVMNSAGYLARMTGPILASDVAWRFGGSLLLFFGMFGILLTTISTIFIYYKRLVPHPESLAILNQTVPEDKKDPVSVVNDSA
jgi:MFS family permease